MRILLFLSLLCLAYGTRRRALRDPVVPQDTPLPPSEWFTQHLDHFDPANTNTWQQRYFTNNSFFLNKDNDSPVFLMIGGEGEASPKWMVQGAWIEYAATYGALCFQLEHRFYGQSHPTKDMSTANLRYLSSEQALADLANFITGMNKKYSLKSTNKWIVFGGSYPGSLAAWARFKYPHLIHGAMSASGPLLAKKDFSEYFDVVRASLNSAMVNGRRLPCAEAVHNATRMAVDKMMNSTKDFVADFNVCDGFDTSKTFDVYMVVEGLSDIFAETVQYNKDHRLTSLGGENPTIDDLCTVMADESLGTPYERLKKLYAKYNDPTVCMQYSYEDSVKEMKEVSWKSGVANGARQWTYQTCTEFGFYQTSSGSDHLFLQYIPLEFSTKLCSDVYGEKFTEDLLDKGIDRTNLMYGALHPQVTRTVFVHGSIDPWHALGITQTQTKDAPAIYIYGTAHCANMYPSSPDDPDNLKNARKTISKLIGKWLKQNCTYFDD